MRGVNRTAVRFIPRRAHWSPEGFSPCASGEPAGLSWPYLPTSLCATGFADDDAVKKELKRHQGTWIATSSTFDGQKAPEDIVHSIKRIVTDDHVVWQRDGKQFAGTKIVLDSTNEPNTIDVIPDGGPQPRRAHPGHLQARSRHSHDLHGWSRPAPAQGIQGRERERMDASDVCSREAD